MDVDVKICGLTTLAPLQAALAAGASYVGFVFYQPSPRYVSPETAAILAAAVNGRAKTVGLFVDPSDQDIETVLSKVDLDFIQLHGQENPARAAEIKRLADCPIIKAIGITIPEDTALADAYDNTADMILFDAKPTETENGALPGGNGIPFDWRCLEGMHERRSFMLSGGLDPENVGAAISLTKPAAVDVSSGVERARGKKDVDLIHRFIGNVRHQRT